jgi:hypothetical protein
MTTIYRISRPGCEPVTDVGSLGAVKAVIRASEPGRYHVDEISPDPLPPGHTSRRWGGGIKRTVGIVVLEPDPWPDL